MSVLVLTKNHRLHVLPCTSIPQPVQLEGEIQC